MLGDLGKSIVAKDFKKLPKVQKTLLGIETGPAPKKLFFERHFRLLGWGVIVLT